MADLNNTIVRGKLRVTEDINANGNITGSSITLSSVKNAGILGTDSSGKVYNNSSAYQPKGDYVPFDNASKDVYLGSHGIHSGTRPSSGSATLMGNGYWIQESSVGVSSALIGGTTPNISSEMTPDCVSISNGKIKLNTSGIVSDGETFTFDGNPGSVATSVDLKNYQKKGNYVTTDTAQTITGRKTFNSPANVNGQEVATAIFKTSNGGQLVIGKEGPNSGTMLRFDQTAGTTRLQFRASATPGAMVWTQPEKGAKLYFDLTNSAGTSTRTTLDARSGTIARTSDIGNGKITIQKNGTDVGSFTTNQSGSKTIDLTLGVSDVSGLQSTLDGKMDTYTITKEPSSMGKDGFAQFGYDVNYQLTQYYQLSKAFGYVKVLEKGGEVSNNNSYFTGFGDVGGGTYIGTAIYDRDYSSPTSALYTSHGLLIDAYGSAFLLSGSRDSETIKRIATTDDTDSLQSSIDGKANKTHTHAISEITSLQSTLDGKANVGHGHAISAINNLQDALDRKQNKIEYPCSFDNSSSNRVKLSRDGTDDYYVHIQRGNVTYNGSTTQYPEINVTFPQAFNGTPTVVVTFTPTSNSTGTYEALKVLNITSRGFSVITRMSASISSGYFRFNWIAIYTV